MKPTTECTPNGNCLSRIDTDALLDELLQRGVTVRYSNGKGFDRTVVAPAPKSPMAEKYPKYYKAVGNKTEVDVYAVHQLFNVQDPSGALQHASKKLLLSGVRTGGKSMRQDICEARDTLNRWLELNSTPTPISTSIG